jgi:hypothetical protein
MPSALANFFNFTGFALGLMMIGALFVFGYWIVLVIAGRVLDARDRKRNKRS